MSSFIPLATRTVECGARCVAVTAFLQDPRDLTASHLHQDCRDVEKIVEETFGGSESRSALVVYVGQRPECVVLIARNFVCPN